MVTNRPMHSLETCSQAPAPRSQPRRAYPKSDDDFCNATRFGFPMKPWVKCHDSLDRMKLYAGSRSHDETYRQDHCGDDPSPAPFDFGHLEFAVGDAWVMEQVPHPSQPGVPTKGR